MTAKAEYIFMKLSKSKTVNGIELSAENTIRVYASDEKRKGYTWFSLSSIISAQTVSRYNDLASNEQNVRIVFVINNERHNNEIVFSATVNEIVSSKTPTACPENGMYPEEYSLEEQKTWLKLTDIRKETDLRTEMFEITSTKKDLLQVISSSQYNFGYVNLKQ